MASFVAALALLPACAGGPTPAPSIESSPERTPSDQTATSPGTDDAEELASEDPSIDPPTEETPGRTTVTLLDAGDEPHRELRYDFERTKLDVPVAATLTTTYGVSGRDADGDAIPERAPTTIAAPTEVTVVDVDDEGAATVAFEYGSGEVTESGGLEGAELAAVEEALATLAEVEATYQVDDRGFVTLLDAEGPDGGEAATDVTALAQRVPAFVQPLPADPVGIGARWTVTTTVELGGLPLVHTVTVELLDRDGDLLELLFTVDDAAPLERSEPDGEADDRARTISSLSLDGGGNVTTRLDRPVPIGAAKGLTADLVLELLRDGERTRIDRTILSDASLETDG
jgi:hypothetical protein